MEYKYHVSAVMLQQIKQIYLSINDIKNLHLSSEVLGQLQLEARAHSSFASTSIEGNPLPLTEVRKIFKQRPKQLNDSEREVLNYNEALIWLTEQIKDKNSFQFNLKFILDIHKIVTKGLVNKFNNGKLRTAPVFVFDPRKNEPVFLPPDSKEVRPLLEQLIASINKHIGTVDIVILAGIFHKCFVLIHPFIDGNGRTTRLVTKALLFMGGIDIFHLFSFENYYNKNVTAYFLQVGEIGDYYDLHHSFDYTKWLEYFCMGINDELLRVKKEIEIHGILPGNILHDHHKTILSFIEKNGYINDLLYSKITARAKATRSLDFKYLIKLKMIEMLGKGKSTIYKKCHRDK